MKTLKSLLWLSAFLLCIASCSKEEVTEKIVEVPEGKIPVLTEITVDGVVQTNTRASSEAGYTTGDGLYDSGEPVTVSAVANDGYELAAFYDKTDPSTNLGASFDFKAKEPRTFKAEFARKYTITVSASPTAGGTVAGGGKYRSGKTCTLTATANAGYVFDGWYEGSTKLSSNASYSFTVSSNRTITGKFKNNEPHIYITLTNSHFDPRDCSDIGYLTAPLDYNGEIPDYTINSDNVKTYAIYKDASGYAPVYVQANSYSDNEFLGWYDGNANLLSTYSSLEETEISEMQKGTSIFAKFSERQSTSDESYTINVVARSWDGSWHLSPNGFVGFDSNYTKTTIIAKHGDTVTVYAEGKTGNDDSDYGTEPWWYYVKGFYTPSHSALLTFNDVDKYVAQYTFEAKMNQDIYVEFVYYKR